ncbi:MAG TPA: FtsX-like permease family protein [Terriglobales bacterium]|jgi:ABC-type antimicrobial peptide transport system permease subunit
MHLLRDLAVARGCREIGIHMALGATRRRLVGDIVGHAIWVGAAGAIATVVMALMLSGLLSSMVVDVSVDPIVFVLAPLLLLAAAALASYLPARRAANDDPLVALRHE